MDYEKKYKNALEWARGIYPNAVGADKEDLEHYFPELKESEDERIRKWLIAQLKIKSCDDNSRELEDMIDKSIAWLEKQGEKIQYWKPSEEQLDALDYAYNSCPDTERGNYYEGVLETIIDDLHKLSEKQGEHKPAAEMKTLEESLGIDSETYNEIVNECIYDKQEPADKIEPKFKVGNWYQCTKDFFGKGVTFDKNTAYYCAKEGCLQNEYGCHIAIVEDLYDNFKLWTIEDAKDGDVLVVDNMPFIYNGHKNEVTVGAYCGFNEKNRFSFAYNYVINRNITPATKEQCDKLEKAITDAEYAWDAEKKELKKIEQKPDWGEEDNYGFDCVAQCITQATLSSNNKQDSDICKCARNWINSIKQRLINT